MDRADLAAPKDRAIATFPADFSARDYSTENLKRVRESLHAALVRDGLYGDEADGLLNTWEASYFRRPGLRLFFLVPRQWTDQVLPLRVSGGADTTRVMVGRIEIVTPHQRDLLRQIARGPVSDSAWVQEAMKKAAGGREDFYREEWYQKLMNGERSLTSLNIEIPNDYRAYLSLGRFRNALILDEQQRHPSATLAKFIEAYDLEAATTSARTNRKAGCARKHEIRSTARCAGNPKARSTKSETIAPKGKGRNPETAAPRIMRAAVSLFLLFRLRIVSGFVLRISCFEPAPSTRTTSRCSGTAATVPPATSARRRSAARAGCRTRGRPRASPSRPPAGRPGGSG